MCLADLRRLVDVVQSELQSGQEADKLGEAELLIKLNFLFHRVTVAMGLAAICH